MSLTPYHGHFGRQQEIFDPICPPPNRFNFPTMPSPWDMHAPLPPPLPQLPIMAFSARNRIEHEETPDTHLFKIHLPVNEDVRVRVEEGRVLHISARGADKKEERKDERGYYRMESSCGEFESKLKLPEDAKVEYLRSFVKDGLLTVTVPREKAMAHNFYAHRDY